MPVPVIVFLVVFTAVMAALPVVALRAYREGALKDTTLTFSWMPLAMWLVAPVFVYMSGHTPPLRSTSLVVAMLLAYGMALAVAVALTKGAPKSVRNIAWACSLGLLFRAAFAAVAAIHLLPA